MKAKKSPSKSTKNSFDAHTASRAIVALLIVLLALSVLLLFTQYQQNIVANNAFVPFMALTTVGMGLLVTLLFLMNPAKKK